MNNLKPCPCGQTPKKLNIVREKYSKFIYASGTCCGFWEIEVRVGTNEDYDEVYRIAVAGWNAAPRGEQE